MPKCAPMPTGPRPTRLAEATSGEKMRRPAPQSGLRLRAAACALHGASPSSPSPSCELFDRPGKGPLRKLACFPSASSLELPGALAALRARGAGVELGLFAVAAPRRAQPGVRSRGAVRCGATHASR
eukprot:scaffold49771_cov65-Phaeocystis_antarctica.AAC.6